MRWYTRERRQDMETEDGRQDQETGSGYSRLETVDMRQEMRDRKMRPGT